MYKLRIRDTEKNLNNFINYLKLKESEGDLIIYSVSDIYKDKNSLFCRMYIEIDLKK